MPERFLLIRLSAIGDVINTLPALSLLRNARPAASISYVVEDRAAELLIGHPCVDQVFVFERRRFRELMRAGPVGWGRLRRELRSYAAEIRAAGAGVALDFQGNLKGAMHSAASGAERRLGFARGHSLEGSRFFATETVVPPPDRPHRVDKFCSLLAPLGVEGTERVYRLPSSRDAEARAAAYRGSTGLVDGGFVVVHPGTSDKGATKRWDPEHFGRVVSEVERRAGVRVLVTWGPGEEGLARAVLRAADGAGVIGPRPNTLLDLAALLSRASLFISGDTGPMHLAAATGVRCLALFGPKNPAIYRPYGEGHRVIHKPDAKGVGSMAAIEPAEVVAAATEMLAGSNGS